ncbi:PhzF family phenazine biosynthesis protein [Candidatus Bathyarchaeota archaeon]|nr:PhzF family phenazine biosynthesis protein [Candidatus Bathyarchaeota archaeon]
MNHPLYIVDVFAEAKYEGNQLAVILDKVGIETEMMQKLTREMHFSETTFITASDLENKTFKVRIFTPESELPFAGHPTLGTAYIAQKILLKKKVNELTLDMKAGKIPVSFNYDGDEPGVLWMKQLPPVFGDKHPVEKFAEFLGLKPEDFDTDYPIQEVSTGVYFYIIPLKTREALKRVKIDFEKLSEYSKDRKAKWPFMFCSEPENPENHLKARMIASFTEDPATGSANGCFAGYLVKHRYFGGDEIDVRVEQGAEIKRPSILYLKAKEIGDGIEVQVGGKVAFVAEGKLV